MDQSREHSWAAQQQWWWCWVYGGIFKEFCYINFLTIIKQISLIFAADNFVMWKQLQTKSTLPCSMKWEASSIKINPVSPVKLTKDIYNIYVGLTSTTLSRRITMHLSDTSSIAQHLKKIHTQQQNHGIFLPKTQQY